MLTFSFSTAIVPDSIPNPWFHATALATFYWYLPILACMGLYAPRISALVWWLA